MGVKKQANPGQYDESWFSWAVCLAFGERFYEEKKKRKKSKIFERTVEISLMKTNYQVARLRGWRERKKSVSASQSPYQV